MKRILHILAGVAFAALTVSLPATVQADAVTDWNEKAVQATLRLGD